MTHIQQFTFNPFQENTFVISNEQKQAWIIDPGCYNDQERQRLDGYIQQEGLKVEKLLNTHSHLDHIFSNEWVKKQYGVELYAHKEEQQNIDGASGAAMMFGVPPFETGPIDHFIDESQELFLGEERFSIRFAPGHSPGHVVFIKEDEQYVIGGDVLFAGSVGRADLPGGDFPTLERSIREQLYTLPDDYTVYPGHGPSTTIGQEKQTNAFVQA